MRAGMLKICIVLKSHAFHRHCFVWVLTEPDKLGRRAYIEFGVSSS